MGELSNWPIPKPPYPITPKPGAEKAPFKCSQMARDIPYVNRDLIGTHGRLSTETIPDPTITCTPNGGVENRRPQIEYVVWGRAA